MIGWGSSGSTWTESICESTLIGFSSVTSTASCFSLDIKKVKSLYWLNKNNLFLVNNYANKFNKIKHPPVSETLIFCFTIKDNLSENRDTNTNHSSFSAHDLCISPIVLKRKKVMWIVSDGSKTKLKWNVDNMNWTLIPLLVKGFSWISISNHW